MSKSYSPVNANTDSFEAWVNKTNDLLVDMSNVVVTSNADGSSGITNGSVTINDTLAANTGAFTTLRGGNTSTSNTLTITSATVFTDEVNLKGGGNYLKIWDNNSTNYYTLVTGNIAANYAINMAAGDVTLQAGTLVPTTGTGATGNWDINANTASAWATARTISLSGDASGSVTINGSSNATLSVTVADNSHNHTIANVTGLQTAVDSKVNITAPVMNGDLTGTSVATQAEAEAGTSNTKIMTPVRVGQAFDAKLPFTPVQQGGGSGQLTNKIYLGWNGSYVKAQVDGSDQGGILTTNNTGVFRKATTGEAQGGTNDASIMTPLLTAQAINAQVPPPTTAQVLNATAGAGAGAVGSYALLRGTNNTQFSAGSNYAGSSLAYAGFAAVSAGQMAAGAVTTGTWKSMGHSVLLDSGGITSSSRFATMFLRIA